MKKLVKCSKKPLPPVVQPSMIIKNPTAAWVIFKICIAFIIKPGKNVLVAPVMLNKAEESKKLFRPGAQHFIVPLFRSDENDEICVVP